MYLQDRVVLPAIMPHQHFPTQYSAIKAMRSEVHACLLREGYAVDGATPIDWQILSWDPQPA